MGRPVLYSLASYGMTPVKGSVTERARLRNGIVRMVHMLQDELQMATERRDGLVAARSTWLPYGR